MSQSVDVFYPAQTKQADTSVVQQTNPGKATVDWSDTQQETGMSLSTLTKTEDMAWSNQMPTHLPDQVVYKGLKHTYPFMGTFQAVVMFLDISGTYFFLMMLVILCWCD